MKKLILLFLLCIFTIPAYAGTWLILIDEGTYRPGSNNIGDVVSVYENDAPPSGVGYTNFKCVEVPNMTGAEARAAIGARMPEIKRAFKAKTPADEWGFDPPDEAEFWNDNGSWKQIVDHPKYQINIPDPESKESNILDTAIVNISTDADNQTVKTELSTTELEATK